MRIVSHNIFLLALLAYAAPASAQFSPGELAKAHHKLEGINNCTQCHDLGKKIDRSKCLDCHTEIKSRIADKRGYHATSEVSGKECITCHHDHNGQSFNMIEWKPSREKFDHDKTGYKLEGKHKTDQCAVCHKSEFVKDPNVIKRTSDGLELSKTYLGLTQECQSCHFDEHRGQLKDCAKCHDFEEWKKSSDKNFDHAKTKYPLTGLHTKVECIKCHPAVADAKVKPDGKPDPDYFKYTSLEFSNCTPCHADPHKNKFGQKCETCHNTSSWLNIKNQKFDHSITRYPLLGKHAVVTCESCHQPDRKKAPVYKDMKFAACRDCHVDAHLGQLAARADSGKCEACHDVNGFRPSQFTVARHALESKYQLQGAHEKTECIKCHIKAAPDEFTKRSGITTAADSSLILLKFKDQRCASCHADIHRGQFAAKLKTADCDICHKTTAWKELKFDHQKDSEFALLGKHKLQSCDKCHPTVDSTTTARRVLYKPVSKFCESCHKDIHEQQFTEHSNAKPEQSQTNCEKCHGNDAFKPSIFDHNKQSRYALTGAHAKVACAKCHIPTRIKTDTLNILYKPISIECASCHPDQHEGVFESK